MLRKNIFIRTINDNINTSNNKKINNIEIEIFGKSDYSNSILI